VETWESSETEISSADSAMVEEIDCPGVAAAAPEKWTEISSVSSSGESHSFAAAVVASSGPSPA